MKKGFMKQSIQTIFAFCILLVLSLWIVSCKEEYYYDNVEPEFLGASIYDYLKSNGNYDYYTRLIEDVEYTSILSKTGSKTLFVANDTAFERFFKGNQWEVASYNDLSLAQKKMILKFSMIDNAFLIETLSNYYNGSLQEGTALRRETAISVLDSIPFKSSDNLPKGSWWDRFHEKGIYLLEDGTELVTVHFLQAPLDNAGISNSDFRLITGVERNNNDAHIFNDKVIERDITCKNGYIHVLEDVLVPPLNMAQYLRENPNTQIFSNLLERFCAPYYNASLTEAYNEIHPDNRIDSIFEKHFFSSDGVASNYPNGEEINSELLLPFDPGMNEYGSHSDMAAIICPSDDAMEAYFESGSGIVLKERYGNWGNVPDEIVLLLLKRHLRESFLESVPSNFDKMNDSENSPIPISTSDISNTYVGVNGVVYQTEKVYSPDDYVSVYGPVLFSEKTQVFNWVILENDFRLYLNSLVSTYSLFVPTDEFFNNYIDPIAYAKDVKAAMKYWYNTETSTVNATVYAYNSETGEVGDSINVITNTNFLANRLLDILDAHIVIGDVEAGSQFYFTKNGNILKVDGAGNSLKIQGGNDIVRGITINVVPNGVFEQQNGRTYFIDKPIQTPLRSVYKVLSQTPEFNDFFALLDGFSATNTEIFVKKKNYYGIDFNIKFLNTFNYTIYVPTNEAIQSAIDSGIIRDWDQINALADETEKEVEITKLERFIRYHFQDNAVFISGEQVNELYQTATIKTNDLTTQFRTYKDKYYRLRLTGDGDNLMLSTENYGSANVIKDNGLYNIMARDYIFSDNPQAYSEVDGTGTGTAFTSSSITTSSTAVIHQIDNVLRFE